MTDHWSEQAEESVLGAIMFKPTCMGRVDLVSGDFFAPKHRAIWDTLREMVIAKKKIDVLTLFDALGDQGRAVGGVSALTHMVTGTITADNVEHYAAIVRRKALERAIRAAASAVVSSELEGDELLAQFQKALCRVSKRVPDRSTTMADLAQKVFDEIVTRVEGTKERPVISTGLVDLDHALGGGLEPGTTTVIGGWTSEGKSSLLRTIANNVARAGHGVDYYSLEASQESLGRRALADNSGIEHMKVRTFDRRKQPTRKEMSSLTEGVDRLVALRNWRITNRAGLSSGDIALQVRRARENINTGLIVVDYLQKLKERGASRREQVGVGMAGLAELALNEDLPMLTASQFSRKPKDSPNRAPNKQDFRESGDIEQDTDNALLIYHHNDWHGVIVAKQRDGDVSRVRLIWDKERVAWRDYRTHA